MKHTSTKRSEKSTKAPREPAAKRATSTTPTAQSRGGAVAPPQRAPQGQAGASVCRSALLVVGNYHAVMAGLVLKKEKFYLKFAIKHHVGNVNDVAVTDRYVASCGADERIFLFTNKAEQRLTAAQRAKLRAAGETMAMRLADLGSLTPPYEALCLGFTSGSQYLLCGCADGHLLVYRTRDWALMHNLAVHEKGLLGFAAHPGSGGALVVSVGADRRVAVLDLAKGRLLTKWKYTTEVDDDGEDEEVAAEDGSSGADGTERQGRKRGRGGKDSPRNPLARLLAKEEPIKVVFSPEGTRFLIQAHFSFVVYSAATMQAVQVVRRTQPPQPSEEIHSVTFADEDTILVGDESACVLFCRLGEACKKANPTPLLPVKVSYPESVRAEAEALLATPIHPDTEVRKKNPLRHVSRIKALSKVGQTLFSLDSNGIVCAWTLAEKDEGGGDVTLHYVTSANCQGRTTSLAVLPL